MVIDSTNLDAEYVNEVDHTKSAHDALGLSHDSLVDVSSADHHARYTDAEAVSAVEAETELILKQIELRSAPSAPAAGYPRLGYYDDALEIKTQHGYTRIGARNTSWSHFYTDRPAFYFDTHAEIAGNFSPYTSGAHNLGTSSKKWNEIHGTTIYEGGDSLADKYIQKGVIRYPAPVHCINLMNNEANVSVQSDYGYVTFNATTDQWPRFSIQIPSWAIGVDYIKIYMGQSPSASVYYYTMLAVLGSTYTTGGSYGFVTVGSWAWHTIQTVDFTFSNKNHLRVGLKKYGNRSLYIQTIEIGWLT